MDKELQTDLILLIPLILQLGGLAFAIRKRRQQGSEDTLPGRGKGSGDRQSRAFMRLNDIDSKAVFKYD